MQADNIKHAANPEPGDYWHEMFCPVRVVLHVTAETVAIMSAGARSRGPIPASNPFDTMSIVASPPASSKWTSGYADKKHPQIGAMTAAAATWFASIRSRPMAGSSLRAHRRSDRLPTVAARASASPRRSPIRCASCELSNRTPRRSSSCRIEWLSADGVTPSRDALESSIVQQRRTRSDRPGHPGSFLNSSQY
jgi:hypothetical protein